MTRHSPEPRFAVDRSLTRLARWLRRLGFDAVCRPELDRRALARLAAREGRVLLTRTRRRRRDPTCAEMLVTSDRFRDQLREVDRRYPLGGGAQGSRCARCNALWGGAAGIPCRECGERPPSGGRRARIEAELATLSLRPRPGL